jgi:enediyne biosynthesis protein E4
MSLDRVRLKSISPWIMNNKLNKPWNTIPCFAIPARRVVDTAMTMGWRGVAYMLLILTAWSATAAEPALPQFVDVTERAGIRFVHNLGDPDLDNIVEATGPGAMFFDYDNDGYLDIYFVNGCWHPDISDNRGRALRGKLSNALYRNNGDGTFTDVTVQAGVGCRGYGLGVTCADYDGDGNLDIYVLNYGPNTLYRNNGDGTFTDMTAAAGLTDPLWSVHAAWLDYDGDGHLDLFVANYLTYDRGAFQQTGAYYPADNFPGPLSYPGAQCHLYRNNGDGTFRDVTAEAGLIHPNGRAMSVVAVDIDGDGDVDLYVSNDAGPNNLWINDGQGRFTDLAFESGVAFGEAGQGVSSMGPVIGDVNRDGRLDILIPDMGYGTLLSQRAPGRFVDVTAQSGLAVICGQYTGWGGLLFDYDNDGYLDVFVANGDPHHLFVEEPVLARNNGQGRFIDVALHSGEVFREKFVGRGAVYGDFDNDGDLDLLMCNIQGPPCLMRNDGGNRRNWIKVIPLNARGQVMLQAVVSLEAGGLRQMMPAIGANGYLGSHDPRPHFGLGDANRVHWIEVVWPDGRRTRQENVAVNQILTVRVDEP